MTKNNQTIKNLLKLWQFHLRWFVLPMSKVSLRSEEIDHYLQDCYYRILTKPIRDQGRTLSHRLSSECMRDSLLIH